MNIIILIAWVSWMIFIACYFYSSRRNNEQIQPSMLLVSGTFPAATNIMWHFFELSEYSSYALDITHIILCSLLMSTGIVMVLNSRNRKQDQ